MSEVVIAERGPGARSLARPSLRALSSRAFHVSSRLLGTGGEFRRPKTIPMK